MAGPRSLTPRSLESESLHQARDILSTESLLCKSNLVQSCQLWFEDCHAWFPLMHQQTLIRCLENFTTISATGRPLVFQAIMAATLESNNRQDRNLGDVKALRIKLKDSTILAALNSPSLDSIQALLVLSMLQYGNSCFTEAGNLLAICRKYAPSERNLHHNHYLLTHFKIRYNAWIARSRGNVFRHYDY